MDLFVAEALRILEDKAKYSSFTANNVTDTKNYLRLKLADKEHEVFAVMFLTNQHNLIQYEEMFRGTIDSASVYPREVVKRALELNAAAIVISHNHPSGVAEPSESDKSITQKIKDACNLVDIRLLDHFVVSTKSATSFAEEGIL